MVTKKPKALFYLVIRETSRQKYKSRTLTVYEGNVPREISKFKAWLRKAIDKCAEERGG